MRRNLSILVGICVAFAASEIPVAANEPQNPLAHIPESRSHLIPETIEDWPNPVLTIGRDGISFYRPRLLGVATQKPMPVAQVRTALIAISPIHWPNGRVLAVMQQSILSGDDDELIQRYAEELKAMLDNLDVEIVWWPVG